MTRRVVLLEDRQDARRREAVDRGHDGRIDQPAVGQRQEVEVVVDQVELAGPLEDLRDVQALPDLGVERVVFGIRARARSDQRRLRDRVGRREQRDRDAASDQALGQQRHHALPRPVMTRRNAPRDRRQHRHAEPVEPGQAPSRGAWALAARRLRSLRARGFRRRVCSCR